MTATNPIEDAVERFVHFIVEREAVRLRKESGRALIDHAKAEGPNGGPAVWTLDPILQKYRFCNIHREDDAVTRWICINWREPNKDNPDVWFLMCVARLFNNVETLEQLPVLTKNNVYFRNTLNTVLRNRQKAGARIFNPAYMITTAGKKQEKVGYILDLLETLWSARDRLRPMLGDTLCSWHMQLGMFGGIGSFLAGQVVADMRHVHPLNMASDLHSFAASGPGSRRGMNRVLCRPVGQAWQEDDWRLALNKLQRKTAPMLRRNKIELHGQDLQNCLCEHDKYERTRLGEGKPKQLYRRTP